MTEVWVMTPSYRGRHMNTLMRIKPAYVLHNIHYAKSQPDTRTGPVRLQAAR